MTYTPDVPQSGETLGGTRGRINTNFQEIANVMKINHVAFNDGGEGKHKFLQMPEVTVAGAGVPVTAANEGGIYAEVGANPTETNLFFRGESNGKSYQLTTVKQANQATFGVNTNYTADAVDSTGGWSFLPGGLIVQWGIQQSGSTSTTYKCRYQYEFQTILTQGFSVVRNDTTTTDNDVLFWINESTIATTGFNVIKKASGSKNYKIAFYGIGIGFA